MNELIKINYENAERPTVLGRELHEVLGVGTPYNKWFPRMCEYGFTEMAMMVFSMQRYILTGRKKADSSYTKL